MGKVTSEGYVAERLDEIVTRLEAGFRGIYGDDIDLSPDSPDSQLIGLIAQVKADLEELGVDIYRQLDPDWATGKWLEQRVAYAGLRKRLASYSYLRNVALAGREGAQIPAGYVVSDPNKVRWRLVSRAVLDANGTARGDFRSENLGRYPLPAGTALKIETVALGWTSATTVSDAEVGSEEEKDPALRARFFRSRSKPATAAADAIEANIWDLPDVRQVVCLENFTDLIDADGVPAHGINVVVDGGDDAAIGRVIYERKTLGTSMRGEVAVNVLTKRGKVRVVYFDRPRIVSCAARLQVVPYTAETAIDQDAIRAAIAGTSFLIGEEVHYSRLFTPINTVQGFWVRSLVIGEVGGPLSDQNIDVDVRSLARFAEEDIAIEVVSP